MGQVEAVAVSLQHLGANALFFLGLQGINRYSV